MFRHDKSTRPIGKMVSVNIVDDELVIKATVFARDEFSMDDLLKALINKDQTKVFEIGSKLLVTRDNQVNRPQANMFERYAPCRITPAKSDAFHFRAFVGIIEYNDQIYYFG